MRLQTVVFVRVFENKLAEKMVATVQLVAKAKTRPRVPPASLNIVPYYTVHGRTVIIYRSPTFDQQLLPLFGRSSSICLVESGYPVNAQNDKSEIYTEGW